MCSAYSHVIELTNIRIPLHINALYKIHCHYLFCLWIERNASIFSNKAKDSGSVFKLKDMERNVRERISSWQVVENTHANWLLCLACLLKL